MLSRRHLLRSLVAAGAAAVVAPSAMAQKALRLIVPFPPGGGGDTIARSVVDTFKRYLKRDVWVDNRPGAGGALGTAFVAQAKHSTIGYVTNGILCVNQHLYPLKFDPLKDLKPIGQVSRIGLVVVLNPKVIDGVTDLKSLIAYAKAHPGQVNFASSGNGTTSHLAGQYLEQAAGIELTHIPYRGGAAAMLDVLSGRIPLMIDVAPNALPHVESGKLKALAVTTPTRLDAAPAIPTLQELGFDMTLFAWDGFVAPANTSDEQVRALNTALVQALKDPDVASRLKAKGAEPCPGTEGDFAAFIHAEAPKWEGLVKAVNAKEH